jgi:hypothetical protein
MNVDDRLDEMERAIVSRCVIDRSYRFRKYTVLDYYGYCHVQIPCLAYVHLITTLLTLYTSIPITAAV